MTTRTKINEATCPIRIVAVARPYGFKTIGAFYKFLKQCLESSTDIPATMVISLSLSYNCISINVSHYNCNMLFNAIYIVL